MAKKTVERSVRERVETAYRHLHPDRPNTRGCQRWFRRELANRGVEVTPTTIHKWLVRGVPVDRLPEVDSLLLEVEERAKERLEAALKELGP